MNATDKQSELTDKLLKVLSDFHESNTDLFVEDIMIRNVIYGNMRKVLTGISLTVTVQPAQNETMVTK